MGVSDANTPLKTTALECSHFPIWKESDSVKEERVEHDCFKGNENNHSDARAVWFKPAPLKLICV